MKPKKKRLNRISNQKPQTVVITKIIIMEADNYNIIGSGYMIEKRNGESRLDIMDLGGKHLPPGWYSVQQTSERYLGFTTDLIQ